MSDLKTNQDDELDLTFEDPVEEIENDNENSDSDEYVEDEADAVFDAKEKKKKRSKIVYRLILLISAGVFLFAAWNLFSILWEYKKGNDIYNAIEDKVLEDKPVTIKIGDDENDVEIPFTYNHKKLKEINSDGQGFLYFPALDDLRYPIAQTDNNDDYLHLTFDRQYNANGCLFIDYRITEGLNANHVIIYGHSMNSGAMFGKLHYFGSYWFYNTEGNDKFYIYTEDVIREYKIFSAYVTDPISDTYTFNFPNQASLAVYANMVKEKSNYDTGVNVDNTMQVVTFSTCTNDSKERFIVSGTFVGETKLPSEEPTTKSN